VRARDGIGDFEPVAKRLKVSEAFDYDAKDLPSPVRSYLDGLESPDSRSNMAYALDIFAAFLSGGEVEKEHIPWHELTAEHRDAVRAHLFDRYEDAGTRGRKSVSPSSINTRLTAWRQVMRHAWDKDLMSSADYRRVSQVQSVKGLREKKRRFVEEGDLEKVFRNCALDENRAAGTRDAAMLALLFGCGLRRFEAVSLLLEDIDRQKDGWLLHVIGKRNKERTVGVPVGAAAFVRDWLEIRGKGPGPLFYPVRKNGVVNFQERPMTSRVGNQIVDRRFEAAGVGKFSPQDLRATSTTILAGALKLFETMDWAGHEDANTTKGYATAAKKRHLEIAAKIHVPHLEPSAATK
jgi:integrase